MHLVQTMAYVGAEPWHGLGQRLQPRQPLEAWQQAAGMDWAIEASPVRFFNGSGTLHSFPEQLVLHRSDNHAPLAVVSQRFQVVQPREILEFYRDLSEVSGFELETAGVLKGGKKFWALARTGQSAMLKGHDQVKGYLLLATACDGTLATTAQFTSVRVVCNNTLHIALGDNLGAVKVSHRSMFEANTVKRQLGIAVSSWDSFLVRMKALAERKVSDAQAEAFLAKVLTPCPSTAKPRRSPLRRFCKRRTAEGLVTLPCPTPENCAVADELGCKPYGRLNVQLEGQEDELGSFVFRTTGYNSIRTLAARLKYLQALAGTALPCLPLTLKLRAKSTTQSHRSAVYFVDLVVREGLTLEQALQKAKEESSAREAAGWNQLALDQAALEGLKNGAFEDSEEEGEAVVEEFYSAAPAQPTTTLADKLEAKATAGSAP